nr:MAG TPA: hypothetical protein [Caudoviricetes sp.]
MVFYYFLPSFHLFSKPPLLENQYFFLRDGGCGHADKGQNFFHTPTLLNHEQK